MIVNNSIPSMKMSATQMGKILPNNSWCRIPVLVPFHSYSPKPTRKPVPMTRVATTRAFFQAQGFPPRLSPVRRRVNPTVNCISGSKHLCPELQRKGSPDPFLEGLIVPVSATYSNDLKRCVSWEVDTQTECRLS